MPLARPPSRVSRPPSFSAIPTLSPLLLHRCTVTHDGAARMSRHTGTAAWVRDINKVVTSHGSPLELVSHKCAGGLGVFLFAKTSLLPYVA